MALARWKTPRSARRIAGNSEAFVEEVTKMSLRSPEERLRIEALIRLAGVGWPTASVILHFCHEDPYPILDVRALWSLGVDRPPSAYRFDLWRDYTRTCRRLAGKAGCSMRALDLALWQYSKERQPHRLAGMKKARKAKPRVARKKAKKTAPRRKTIMRHSREG